MRILVTGGTGMVGSHIQDLVNKARNKDNELTDEEKNILNDNKFIFLSRNDCDLTNRLSVMHYFSSNDQFDCIIHLAACVGGLFMNMNNGIKMFSDNIKINENILEMSHKYKIKRGIFCLSSCIYPQYPYEFPMDEKQIHYGAPHPSNEGYAFAKRMLELQCRQYNKAYNTEYICVIPVNLYGEYDNFNLEDGHVIPALMHRFHNTLLRNKANNTNEKHIAYGTGRPLRQFLYAGDFAKIICKILLDNKYKSTEPIICCKDELKIRSMIFALARAMNIENHDIVFDTSKGDGCMRKTVSNLKLQTLYPNFKFKSLQDGLNITYKWFQENYNIIRK